MAQSEPITIKTRSQVVTATNGGKYEPVEKEATWESTQTAVIIVDTVSYTHLTLPTKA